MGLLRSTQCTNSRVSVGPIRIKSCRRINKNGQRVGLVTFPRFIQENRGKMGAFHYRSNGELPYKESNSIQQPFSLSRSRSNRLLYPGLEKRKQLYMLSPEFDTQSIRTWNGIPYANNSNNPSMDISNMVANASPTKNRIYGSTQCRYKFQTESRREFDSGTMEKPILGISRSKNLFLNELLTRVDEHLSPNSIYEKRLQNLWNEFLTFCELHNLVPCPLRRGNITLLLTISTSHY